MLYGTARSLSFAVKGSTAYCVYGPANEYGNLTCLEFFTLDPTTGERRSYHQMPQREGKEIILCDAAVYGNTAVLNYDIVDEYEYPIPRKEKEHHILAFDLTEGSMTAIMERTLDFGELYDLWGMSEDSVILAYHHSSGGLGSFGYQEYTNNYADYAMRLHRWVLMEYPMEENTEWSEQVAEWTANSELGLFSYSSFYEGVLYYVLNDRVCAYDLQNHSSFFLFAQEDITYLCCYDGRIFFETEDGEYFWYKLDNGDNGPEKLHPFQTDGKQVFFPVGESQDYFYGSFVPSWDNAGEKLAQYYLISRADFYAGDFDAAIRLPL